MRRTPVVLIVALFSILGLAAQSRGRGNANPPTPNPGQQHSNAPPGTPAASPDRDFGRQRAVDVGRGKKHGLTSRPAKVKKRQKR